MNGTDDDIIKQYNIHSLYGHMMTKATVEVY